MGICMQTLYKPRDVENAHRNAERYGWARDIVEGWRRDAAFALGKDRAFFDALIPELTPGTHYGQSCPHCVDRQSLMGTSPFDWQVADPDRITCRACGTVYPNDQYPETGALECPRMGQTFTYYETPEERAHPKDRARYALRWLGDLPEMTSFSGMIRDRKVRWAAGQVIRMAKLYALSGDLGCAERAAWILDRFARVFPGYLFHSYDGSYADWPPAEVAENMGRHGGGGRTEACEFYLQGHGAHSGPYAHFSYLALNVEEMFLTGIPSHPVERTLLTTGVLDAALTSRHRGHCRLETPWLDVTYRPPARIPWRPSGPRPAGASLTPVDKLDRAGKCGRSS
jgi:hypothetical protein